MDMCAHRTRFLRKRHDASRRYVCYHRTQKRLPVNLPMILTPLKFPSSPIVPVLQPESSTESAQSAAKVSIVGDDTQVPAAEFVPPMHHKTEHELFLDRMRTALECLQKPFPDENQALRDEREDLVSRATQAWINFDDLTPLEKMGWTKRVQAWVAFFN